MDLLQDGAGTIILDIISSFNDISLGGGGHTKDSMISSVVFIKEARSGGSVLDDLKHKVTALRSISRNTVIWILENI